MNKKYIMVVSVAALGIALAAFIGIGNNSVPQKIACTEEAKLCPDGTAVGRVGPNCEFAACPTFSGVRYVNTSADTITISSPLPHETVSKKFTIVGQARGTYFFEASFPVEVRGGNGELLASTHATAGSDWMTENLVPFTASVSLPDTYSGQAVVVLKKDNPSGLPDKDASVLFGVVIQ